MSRGEYNNNPGNLRAPTKEPYEGQIGVDDNGFAIFQTKELGRKALTDYLSRKIEGGLNTPEKLVNVYAPAGADNAENTEESRNNYKIHLAQQLGLNSTTDPFPKDAVEKLANAISVFEGNVGQQDQTQQQPTVVENQFPQQVIQDRIKQFGDISPEAEKLISGGVGYSVGTGLGATKLGAAKAIKRAYDWANTPSGTQPSAVIPKQEGEPSYGGKNWVKSLTDVDLPGGQMSKKDLDLAKAMQEAVGREGEKGFVGGKITPGGIIITPQTAAAIQASQPQQPQPPTGAQKLIALFKYGSPEQKELARNALSRVKSIPSVSGFGGAGFGVGMSVPSAISEWQKGEEGSPLAALGTGAGVGTLMGMFPKAAPVVGSALGGLDVANRLSKDDLVGAGLSTVGTVAPLAAAALLSGPVSIPVAIGSALIPAAINAYRDYRNYVPPKKTAGAGRGFINPELVQQP